MMETTIQAIIGELQQNNVIPHQDVIFTPMSGTTDSTVGILSWGGLPRLVLKTEEAKQVAVTSLFLTAYEDISVLPNVCYTDSAQRYLVYTYMPGQHTYKPGTKAALLQTLSTRLLQRYRPAVETHMWGWADDPSSSWSDFLVRRLTESQPFVAQSVSEADFAMVCTAAQDSSRVNEAVPYLLHGDCGVHNFLFDGEAHITAVIDPIPVFGPPIYDLTFAFCSSPDDLHLDTILAATASLQPAAAIDRRWLREEVLIALYCRMAACKKHHPHDMEAYLAAWSYWKHLV